MIFPALFLSLFRSKDPLGIIFHQCKILLIAGNTILSAFVYLKMSIGHFHVDSSYLKPDNFKVIIFICLTYLVIFILIFFFRLLSLCPECLHHTKMHILFIIASRIYLLCPLIWWGLWYFFKCYVTLFIQRTNIYSPQMEHTEQPAGNSADFKHPLQAVWVVWACLSVVLMLIYAWSLVNLINFRDFLKPLS